MPTNNKDQIKISSFADVSFKLVRVLPEMALLLVEGCTDRVFLEEFNRARVEWCLSSRW